MMPAIPSSTLFDTSSSSALTPEQILGPEFVSGELFRKEVAEGQDGVKMLPELQFVNQNTCEAISDMLVDIR